MLYGLDIVKNSTCSFEKEYTTLILVQVPFITDPINAVLKKWSNFRHLQPRVHNRPNWGYSLSPLNIQF